MVYGAAMEEITDDQWALIQARRPGAPFLLGVKTTGIFCRSGCPARTPLRKNVVVFGDAEGAFAHGFRPCLRCKPLGEDPKVGRVVTIAKAVQADPAAAWTSANMAALTGDTSRSIRQLFQSVLGLTPIGFRDAVRLRAFKSSLKKGSSVTDAGYEAGYSGPARRHEAAKALAMTPSAYAKGGAGEQIEFVIIPSALGPMIVAATQKGICFLKFRDEVAEIEAALVAEYPAATLVPAPAGAPVVGWAAEVASFLADGGLRPDLPVDLRGTAFQMKVWQGLCEIPRGTTTTYGALAAKIGHPGASRAVGSANGANPVAVVVPCHLVVAVGGKLGGYAGGLDRKKKLLALEQAETGLLGKPPL